MKTDNINWYNTISVGSNGPRMAFAKCIAVFVSVMWLVMEVCVTAGKL